MAFKYKDYLFTPSDVFRGVLYVINNLRPSDVIGEVVIFLILIYTKQMLGWGISASLLPVIIFSFLYWKMYLYFPSLYQNFLLLLKSVDRDDITGVLILILLFLYTKDYMLWQMESALLLLILFAIFYWNLDSRILIILALLSLTACPLFLLLGDDYLQGEQWAERAAVWTYYFLVLGVAKQIFDLLKENKEDKQDDSALMSASEK